MSDKLITSRQAAEILGVHPRTVARWGREGRLDSARVQIGAPHNYRYVRAEIERLATPKTYEAKEHSGTLAGTPPGRK